MDANPLFQVNRDELQVIGQAISDAIEGDWEVAWVDIRFDSEWGDDQSKGRYRRPKEEKAKSFSIEDDLVDIFLKIRDRHIQAGGEHWYGAVFTLRPDGSAKMDLNYDSKCIEDPSFFDD